MRIGLIDVDGHNFPNLALMRISSYHKAKGDAVGWWWEPIAWLCFTPIKLLCALFGKKTKLTSKTKQYAVCQDCDHMWKV